MSPRSIDIIILLLKSFKHVAESLRETKSPVMEFPQVGKNVLELVQVTQSVILSFGAMHLYIYVYMYRDVGRYMNTYIRTVCESDKGGCHADDAPAAANIKSDIKSYINNYMKPYITYSI